MNFKMKGLSAVVLSAGLMVGGVANAGTVAFANLDVNNAQIVDSTGNILSYLDPKFANLNFTNTSQTSANLNGVDGDNYIFGVQQASGTAATDSKTITDLTGPTGLALDLYSVAGTGGSADNAFTPVTAPESGTYSVSDTLLTGAILDFSAAGGPSGPAFANTYSAIELEGTSSASVFTQIQNSSDFQFTAVNDTFIKYEFDLIYDFLTYVSPINTSIGSFSQASYNYSVTLTDLSTFGPSAIVDQFNTGYDFTANNSSQNGSFSGSLSDSVSGNLSAGHDYKLEIIQTTSVSSQSIPEPTSLALLGLGLLGFGAAKRRKA